LVPSKPDLKLSVRFNEIRFFHGIPLTTGPGIQGSCHYI
jgi:hypothetical protein